MAAGHTVELQLFLTVKVAALAPAAKVASRRKRTEDMEVDAMDAVVNSVLLQFSILVGESYIYEA
jgi:fructose-1,6-bisphosphatase/sedoheptulose 1,7-bisphosphatase-like protein